MKTIKYVAPWLAAAAIGGAVSLAPFASADPDSTPAPTPGPTPEQSDTSPFVPYGPSPDYDSVYPLLQNQGGGGVDLPS